MYKISFYVPPTHVELVKNALFSAGAGKIGPYSHCAWQILGEGQFMPLAGSNAFIGKKDQLEKLAEYYVEMVCAEDYIEQAIKQLKQSHPYEEPAYHVILLQTF